MTIEYQLNLLKFACQEAEASKFIPNLDDTVFDLDEHKIMASVVINYYKDYRVRPTSDALKNYLHMELDKMDEVDVTLRTHCDLMINQLYEPLGLDMPFTRGLFIEFTRKQAIKMLFADYAAKIQDADEKLLNEIITKIQAINRMGVEQLEYDLPGKYLFKDYQQEIAKAVRGIPTIYKGLNNLTTAKGFLSPELIIIMAAPKGFKTGTSLNIALGYARDGYNVFIADTENGVNQLITRLEQRILEQDYKGYRDEDEREILTHMVKAYGNSGGEIRCEYFPAKLATLRDVDSKLEELKQVDNFVPDIIIYDYLDNFASTNKRLDKRLAIQDVYFHAIRLNVKWSTFAFSPSQVNSKAVKKHVIDLTDFAEDFGKAANAHAAFAICRSDEEVDAGLGRMIPVIQRMGKRYKGPNTTVYLRFEEERMMLSEISRDEYEEIMGKDSAAASIKGKPKKKKGPDIDDMVSKVGRTIPKRDA